MSLLLKVLTCFFLQMRDFFLYHWLSPYLLLTALFCQVMSCKDMWNVSIYVHAHIHITIQISMHIHTISFHSFCLSFFLMRHCSTHISSRRHLPNMTFSGLESTWLQNKLSTIKYLFKLNPEM